MFEILNPYVIQMGIGQSKPNSLLGTSYSPGHDYDIPTIDMYEQAPSTGILESSEPSDSFSANLPAIVGGRKGNTRKAKKVNRKNTRKNRK